jgi:23S rRNA pseudouridine1911/1915/1917 synthase
MQVRSTNLSKRDFARNQRGIAPFKFEDGRRGGMRERREELFVDESVMDEENQVNEGKTYLQNKKENYKPKDVESWMKDNNFKAFEVLFENERILIINKPIGLMVHPDDRSEEITISDLVYHLYPEMREVGEGDRFGVVHRLDRDTSGALILCKTKDSFKDVKNLFQNHKVKKVYRAIVEGNIREDTGVIDTPIARARSDFRKKAVVDMFSKDFRGAERTALTRYKVIGRSEDKSLTYVEVYPETGRTHQIRVHMRSIRHPIIGDDLYGSNKGKELAPRSMLHAYRLSFVLRKEEINIICPVPNDMLSIAESKFK